MSSPGDGVDGQGAIWREASDRDGASTRPDRHDQKPARLDDVAYSRTAGRESTEHDDAAPRPLANRSGTQDVLGGLAATRFALTA